MDYSHLSSLFSEIDSVSKRLKKTSLLASFIKDLKPEDRDSAILLIQGKIAPDWMPKEIGIKARLVIKALVKTTGTSDKKIEKLWREEGDLGTVAGILLSKKRQASLFPRTLALNEVLEKLTQLSKETGSGSIDKKLTMLSDLLINSEPVDARYIIRTVLDNLRVGTAGGTIRDAIVWAYYGKEIYDDEKNELILDEGERKEYDKAVSSTQHAYDLTNDWGEVLSIVAKDGFEGFSKLKLRVGRPINAMLYQKAKDVEDAFERVGRPAAFELKYDGFRMQIHKNKQDVKIFTRRLEEVTRQFPDVVGFIKKNVNTESCILEGEAVGYDRKTKETLPFQKISQRIKRKHDIDDMAKSFPVKVILFDMMFRDGNDLLTSPFEERRKNLVKSIIEKEDHIQLSEQIVTDDTDKAMEFYLSAIKDGEEGVMAKNLKGIYKPGARVGYGVKLKQIMEPLDLVIVGAEYGEGKRSGVLTSFTLACKDYDGFKEIGRVSTGLKEKDGEEGTTFSELTDLLKPHIIKTSGRTVTIVPAIVIEVGYEEIQKSTSYSSGFALRFPRFLRLRTDEKSAEDANDLEEVNHLYSLQT